MGKSFEQSLIGINGLLKLRILASGKSKQLYKFGDEANYSYFCDPNPEFIEGGPIAHPDSYRENRARVKINAGKK